MGSCGQRSTQQYVATARGNSATAIAPAPARSGSPIDRWLRRKDSSAALARAGTFNSTQCCPQYSPYAAHATPEGSSAPFKGTQKNTMRRPLVNAMRHLPVSTHAAPYPAWAARHTAPISSAGRNRQYAPRLLRGCPHSGTGAGCRPRSCPLLPARPDAASAASIGCCTARWAPAWTCPFARA